MQIVQIYGDHSYTNYCAAYSDCAPTQLPHFTSGQDYIAHVENVSGETDIVSDEPAIEEWLKVIQVD